MSGRPVTFELKVYYYRDETGIVAIDPRRYKFELSVDSEKLGRVTFDVSVREKGVMVSGVSYRLCILGSLLLWLKRLS